MQVAVCGTEWMMKYRTLALSCACGTAPAQISDIGLTTEHQIVFHWRCARCRHEMYLVKSLSDCWRDCPAPPKAELMTSAEDRRFLRAMKVRDPDDNG
jgi:hypothetical protein